MAVCYDVEEVMDHEKIDGYRVSAGIDADADCLRRGGGLEISGRGIGNMRTCRATMPCGGSIAKRSRWSVWMTTV